MMLRTDGRLVVHFAGGLSYSRAYHVSVWDFDLYRKHQRNQVGPGLFLWRGYVMVCVIQYSSLRSLFR